MGLLMHPVSLGTQPEGKKTKEEQLHIAQTLSWSSESKAVQTMLQLEKAFFSSQCVAE